MSISDYISPTNLKIKLNYVIYGGNFEMPTQINSLNEINKQKETILSLLFLK